MRDDSVGWAREFGGCLVDLFGLALVAAGVLGTALAGSVSLIEAVPVLQVASTLALSGVIIMCRWRGAG